jgi:major membrane immunogen (membrane-anchored lipoprotein)
MHYFQQENKMASFTSITLAALLLILVACGAEEEPTGVIPQGHLDAMDKANDVENVLQEAQKNQLEDPD